MATPTVETPEQEMEWYEHIAEHAIDGNRQEGYMLSSIAERVEDTWREGDKTAAEILAFLVENERMVRVEWGGGDVRYYYPGEIEYRLRPADE